MHGATIKIMNMFKKPQLFKNFEVFVVCLGEEPSDSPVHTEILSKAVTDSHLQ
jgi:hypothetical protein